MQCCSELSDLFETVNHLCTGGNHKSVDRQHVDCYWKPRPKRSEFVLWLSGLILLRSSSTIYLGSSFYMAGFCNLWDVISGYLTIFNSSNPTCIFIYQVYALLYNDCSLCGLIFAGKGTETVQNSLTKAAFILYGTFALPLLSPTLNTVSEQSF